MDVATESRSATTTSVFLAGLQAGMIAVGWMLAWMGVSAKWQGRGFWTSENLMASVLYGDAAIRLGFAFSTIAGLALYLILYSLLGALLATALRSRLTGLGTLLASILFALGWYYFFFHTVGKAVVPLVALLHSERPTVFGHVIYGGLVARFHAFLPRPEQAMDSEKPVYPQLYPPIDPEV
jgi:hypothetical protein